MLRKFCDGLVFNLRVSRKNLKSMKLDDCLGCSLLVIKLFVLIRVIRGNMI